jgi:hypothetical protein
MMKCEYRPNGTCPHSKKDFETLKKGFPYFPKWAYADLPTLQNRVCEYCKTEWDIPRFNINKK